MKTDKHYFNMRSFNFNGEKLFDSTYDSIFLYDDIILAKDGCKYGIINNRGIEVISIEYTGIYH